MIEFEIDGKKVSSEEGATIIEAADAVGTYIPRFCYHKKLSIAANCRMCLVEVEKSPKVLPACATPITPEMKVWTKSKLAVDAQRDVMEFLLINHPLDCPICDQGGECELQDLSMGYGRGDSEYRQPKRAVHSQDIGPLIETEMTRCIQCTRCVRFGEEVAGLRELGVVNRGEKEEITTYVKHFLQSEVSGNIIDLCPVGALTNKPARYELRAWEATEHASIAPHDCVGTNIYLHTRSRETTPECEVFRAVPRENEAINETWMSDRDRFSVQGLYHKDRVLKPLMKQHGDWVEVEWQYALDAIAHLTTHIIDNQGADHIAGIASSYATVEENYLLQKMVRSLGSVHIDHRIRELDFSDQAELPRYPTLNTTIADIENLDALLLVGSNIRFEQPIMGTRIFKACQDELTVMAVNPIDYPFVFDLNEKVIDLDIIRSLSEIARACADNKGQTIAALSKVTLSDKAKNIAEKLCAASNAAIFLGAFSLHHDKASTIRQLSKVIEDLTGATVGHLTDGPNAAGAWLAGCVPHRGPAGAVVETVGKDAKTLLTDDPADAYFILNTELENDAAYSEKALAALKQAKLVVCLSTFETEAMRDYADFILPITPFSETSGTYVNATGEWQSFEPVSVPHVDSKPAWKVIRALANFLSLSGFSYQSSSAVRDSLKAQIDQCPLETAKKSTSFEVALSTNKNADLLCVMDWPMYRDNPLVRRAEALQETLDKGADYLAVNAATAERFSLSDKALITAKQGESSRNFKLRIDDTITDACVYFPAGFKKTAGFGLNMSPITLERAES